MHFPLSLIFSSYPMTAPAPSYHTQLALFLLDPPLYCACEASVNLRSDLPLYRRPAAAPCSVQRPRQSRRARTVNISD